MFCRGRFSIDWRNWLAEHGLPLAAIVGLAAASALFASGIGYEYRWTSDTTDTFYRIISTTPESAVHGRGLWSTLGTELGQVLAKEAITSWYQFLFDAYLRSVYLSLGDISLAYKLLVFPLTLVFGTVAYFFFHALTGNRWLALALAVAAWLPMPLSWAGERAGLGPVWTYTRRYLHTAFLPIVAWLYLKGSTETGQGRLLLIALVAAGIASNLHASGILLLEVLVLAWFVAGQLQPRRLLVAVAMLGLGFCFSVAAAGSIWIRGLNTLSKLLLSGMSGESFAATSIPLLAAAQNVIPDDYRYLYYPPRIYDHLPGVMVDAWLIVTLAASLLPLIWKRGRTGQHDVLFGAAAACLLFVSFEQFWPWVFLATVLFIAGRREQPSVALAMSAYLIVATFWVSVCGMLLFQTGLALIKGFPVIFDQLRGIRLMGFWVFIWIAALAAPLGARLPEATLVRRLLLAAIGVAVILHGQTAYRQYFRGQDGDRIERKLALLDLAAWAKANTPKESVFLVGYSAFGIVSERRIVQTDKSVRNTRIEWLPPKGISPPEETPALAVQYAAGYFLMPADGVPVSLKACVLYANTVYALAATSCGQRQLGGAASAPALAGQPLPGALQPLQSGAAGQLVGK